VTVISDIDGTLLRNGIYPIKKVIAHVNAMRPVVLITGRPEKERHKTVMALQAAGVKYTKLLMAPNDQPGIQSKILHAKALKGVTLAIDNDAMVRAGYEHLGIKTVDPSSIK
jgi:ribonucleotide monophosphatase NagD (HAD superfamily)